MKKDNIYSKGNQKKVPTNYFTGPASIKDVSKTLKTPEQKIYHVTFKNGAKTKLHFHDGGQLLIVTGGKGDLVFFNRFGKSRSKFKIKQTKKIPLRVGDAAYIAAKLLHTHGSSDKNQAFTHIAINSFPAKNREPKTAWFESDFRKNVTGIL